MTQFSSPQPYTKTSRVLRAVGDCNTLGAGKTSADACFPSQLLRRLQQSSSPDWTLENLGAAMNTSREGVSRVRNRSQPADLLILNFGLVDAWVTAIPWVYVPYYPDTSWRKRSRKLLKFVKRRLRSQWVRRFIGRGCVVPIEEYRSNLRTIIEVERARNPDVDVVIWSTVMTRDNAERDMLLQRYNEVLEELSSEMNVHFFDAATCVKQIPNEATYQDEVHLTERAAAFLASQLFEQVIASDTSFRKCA